MSKHKTEYQKGKINKEGDLIFNIMELQVAKKKMFLSICTVLICSCSIFFSPLKKLQYNVYRGIKNYHFCLISAKPCLP